MTLTTSQLMTLLVEDKPPSRKGWLYVGYILGGIVLALVMMALLLEPRSDIADAITQPAFQGKLSIFLLFALALLPAMAATGKPAAKLALLWPMLPLLWLLLAAGFHSFNRNQGSLWYELDWEDGIWCLAFIPVIAMPAFDLFCRAVRLLAPTELRHAGRLIGITAGAWGAFAYALSCAHDNPLYLTAWYLSAILLCGLIGHHLGPRWLKW